MLAAGKDQSFIAVNLGIRTKNVSYNILIMRKKMKRELHVLSVPTDGSKTGEVVRNQSVVEEGRYGCFE